MNYNSIFRFILVLISCSFILTSNIQALSVEPAREIEVTVDSPDSIELVGYLYLPVESPKTKMPLLILLHQMRMDHTVWGDFINYVVKEGIAVFAMDLRGHGYSIYDLAKKKIKPKWQIGPQEYLLFPADVRQIVDSTLARHSTVLDGSKMAVIGASIGANTALLYAQDNPAIKYTALISPGLDYRGLKISEAVQRAVLKQHPLYVAVGAKDVYSNLSCALLSDITYNLLDLQVFEAYWHGNDLMKNTSDLKSRIMSDLIKYLKK